MTVPRLSHLQELKEENAKLKPVYAAFALMHHALKDVVGPQGQDSVVAGVLPTQSSSFLA